MIYGYHIDYIRYTNNVNSFVICSFITMTPDKINIIISGITYLSFCRPSHTKRIRKYKHIYLKFYNIKILLSGGLPY